MDEPRRILVIANETCAGAAVCDEVRYRAGPGAARVLVVAPALAGSRMEHWLASDVEAAREDATARLAASVASLRAAGLDATGQLGDADPLQAVDDAYRVFAPDEIVISTHPPARSNWLERRVVQKTRERYPVPVTHVIVDLDHEATVTERDPRPGARRVAPTVTLFRAAGYDEALQAQTRGFRDEWSAADGRSGIVFTDSPAIEEGAGEPTVFAVEIPARLIEPYEIAGDGRRRRFVLPADLVNRHRPRALTADWAE